jgi:hypothetical protein
VGFKIFYGPRDDRLHAFHIPALERSVRYDRSAGSFSSSALAIAAAAMARLIQNGGQMRLLVGPNSTPPTWRRSGERMRLVFMEHPGATQFMAG